jgi:hypothetical protein
MDEYVFFFVKIPLLVHPGVKVHACLLTVASL